MQFQYLLRKVVACRFAIALAVATASFWVLGGTPVHAACAPASGAAVAGDTVVCTGTTTNQDAPDGYGTGAENNLTINVLSGASVTGDNNGLNLDTGNTVNNNGAITGTTLNGILANGPLVVNNGNSGTITADAFGGVAINALGDATIVNSGTITANGILGTAILVNGIATIQNSGTISANGDGGAAVFACACSVLAITNTGLITANGAGGAGILSDPGSTLTAVNLGTIMANGDGAVGIAIGGDGTVTNAGTITALGAGGVGIAALDNAALPVAANIVNSGSIAVVDGLGIQTGDFHFVLNTGAISGGVGAFGIVVGNDSRVDNYGTITALAGGTGVQLFGDRNTLNNFGTIAVTGGIGVSIDGATNVINNAGMIRATGLGSSALLTCACGVAAVINTGTIDGQIFLDVGSALTNSGLVTVTDTDANNTVGSFAHIAGENFVQTATGTLALRVTSDGRNDSLGTASVTSTVTLAGTLRALVQPGLYGNATTYINVVTSGANITTQFDSVTSSSPFFAASAVYNPATIDLNLTRIPFGSVPGMTPNQRTIGNALEGAYSTTLAGNAATFFSNLLAATSVTALDQLSGEGTSAAQNAAFSAGSLFNGAMQTQGLFAPDLGGLSVAIPAAYAPAATRIAPGHEAFASLDKTAALAQQPGRFRIWAAGFGASQSLQGEADTGSASQSVRSAGGVLGFDWQAAPGLRVGVAVGGSESTFSAASLATSGRMTAGHIGVYGMKTWGAYYVAASLSYARFDNSTTRTITGIGPTETVSGRFDSDLLGGRVELGWKQAYGRVNVTPFVAVEPSVVWQHGFTESSTGVFGLSVASQTITSLPTFVGVQVDGRYRTPDGAVLAPYARLSWVHEFEPDRRVSAAFVTLPGASFTVNGARPASDAARLDTGAKLMFRGGLALFANFTGEWSDHTHSYAGSGGFRYAW
jgi:uncharacterized protein with beta-barrel porin domain